LEGCDPNAEFAVGGDGRFYNKHAIQAFIKIAAGNGVRRIVVAKDGFISTPAGSRLIRARKAAGGVLLTASHNPGGPNGDFGIKYNCSNGGPAPIALAEKIEAHARTISEIKMAKIADIDLSKVGVQTFGPLTVEVVDPTEEYIKMIYELFDLERIKVFIKKFNPKVLVDSLHAVSGVYTRKIFCEILGLPETCLRNYEPLEDFGGHHPDPNLTYAKDLVDLMYTGNYDFGVAFDGDADRNLILGNKFFVTPSDSLALIAAHRNAIKYFKEGGFKGVARSMPTSMAVDAVVSSEKEKLQFAETPTGWKFFGNLMDNGMLSLCGEESFGTGCDAIREKDGIWAALAWLSILAEASERENKFVSVEEIVREHWKKYGRNYYSRYDYEEVDADAANKLMNRIRDFQKQESEGTKTPLHELSLDGKKVTLCDDFCYNDPCDKSVTAKQGLRFILEGGTRVLVRLSGTGSVGATIRVYFDYYEKDPQKLNLETKDVLANLIRESIAFIKIEELTGRKAPTVIT